MKNLKKVVCFLIGCMLVLSLCGCSEVAANATVEEGMVPIPGSEKYVVTLEFKQSRFSLDIDEHLKDSANKLKIQVPVDKEYYDSLEVGDEVADEFRLGSFLFKGTLGSTKVKVKDKEVVYEYQPEQVDTLKEDTSKYLDGDDVSYLKEDTNKYLVTLNVKQSHFSLSIGDHLKDSMNDFTFQIPVDKEYYDSLELGEEIADDFRVGSFIFKSSIGSWKVTVEDKIIIGEE